MAVISNLMFAVGFKVADGALRKADKQVGMMKDNWAAVGLAAGAITAAVAGVGFAAVNAANEFNDSMRSIQMATGQTADQMEETKSIATDLYNQNFGQNWQDLSGAITATAQITQQTGDDLKETTQNALLLRDAFGFEVAESVRTVDTMMKNFGITSEEAMNLLAQGTQNGLDKSGDLLDTANEYANQFQALGFTAEEMFDTLAAGSENGAFNLDKVGDAVKEFNIRAKDGSKDTVTGLQMLGLNAEKMMGTFAAGGPEAKAAFQQVMQMVGDIADPVERNTVGVMLMGTQFEDLEATTVASMGRARSEFDMTADKMQEINDIKMNSPGEAMARMGRQIETGILKPLGDKLMPYLIDFSGWLEVAGPQIANVGGMVIDSLARGFDMAASAASFLTDNFDVIGPAAGAFALVLATKLIPTIKLMTTSGIRMTVAYLPFIAIAAGIGLAVAGVILIFKNWGTISAWLVGIWNAFKTWVIGLFNSIAAFFVTWGTVIWSAITSAVSGIVSAVSGYWNTFTAVTMSVFNAIVGFFSSVWNSIWSTISNVANSIVSFVTNAWNTIKDVATSTWEGIGTGLSNMWTNVKNSFSTGVNFITGLVNNLIRKINSALSIKLPDWLGGKEFAINIPEIPEMPVDGSHAAGLPNVPFDGYIAELHKGERVLTADENKAYSSGYTPETAPARASSGSSSTSHMEVSVKVDVNGSSMGGPEKAAVMSELQALFESIIRRNGLEVAAD
ncbi:phage tail tape measure protein, TP901 family [Paenibacillus algicola]|uniref:Phage tail tape measure protein, TP901 family n=1 Tax=Paenibacillus algicola TaxID=2565926 RepID=A0A4P8XKN1_9BACL|nr:phage tail tape measure protein [Paenibacillus algicola]QCT03287.1 phage tail tape measure protein, TP901 family [Paenibacillus algicola]